jgi:hypothetical protein
MTNNQIDIAKTLFAMSISCYICVKMRYLDRVMHGESIGEKNELASTFGYVVTSDWSFIHFYVNFALISQTVLWQLRWIMRRNIDTNFRHNSDNYEMCHKMKKSDICSKRDKVILWQKNKLTLQRHCLLCLFHVIYATKCDFPIE